MAAAILTLSLVAILGLALGNLKFRGVGLGVSGVLFAGLLAGHLGLRLPHDVLAFTRDFGLILFVYTIGMQVGPGFLASLRQEGFRMNLLAAAVVLLGGLLAVLLARLLDQEFAAMVGVFAGATTNTPALGAAQEALKNLPGGQEGAVLAGMGYAVAYPGGIAGLIACMLLFQAVFRVNPAADAARLEQERAAAQPRIERLNVVVDNPNLDDVPLADLPGLRELAVTISRIKPAGAEAVQRVQADTRVHRGDVLLAVGLADNLRRFRLIVGKETTEDLMLLPGEVTTRRLVVTGREALGRTLMDLDLPGRLGVTVTRISRGEVEFSASARQRLQFGDIAQVVGRDEDVRRAETFLGNSARALNHTNFLAIFVGIALGVLVGLYPVDIPGLPVPLRLGLAGGPLLVALFISRLGHIGPVVWHMPFNANLALRELGLTLFLASVGLSSGVSFVATLMSGEGLVWMGAGLVITVLPLLVVGWIGHRWVKLRFASLCGLLAGSMTDPPALAFATGINKSDAPTYAYATVYPLTMILRIVVAQVLTLVFCG